MCGAQARDAKADTSFVQVADHAQFLRRRHALESFDLHRVKRLEHGGADVTPAVPERQETKHYALPAIAIALPMTSSISSISAHETFNAGINLNTPARGELTSTPASRASSTTRGPMSLPSSNA